jgi:hypothetical protein
METKVCNSCNIKKELCEFGIVRKNIDGLRNTCKVCKNIDDKRYRENNKEKIYENKRNWVRNNPNHKKNYYEENKERLKLESRIFYEKNKLKYNKQSSLWNKVNSEKRKEITKKHKQIPEIKLKEKIRHRVYLFLKSKNWKKNNKTFEIVGCSPQFLKEHLEKQFTDGMSWDKMGKYIHIDHIIPLSSAKTEEELYKLCYYTNLQPLWAEDNMKKGNKIL